MKTISLFLASAWAMVSIAIFLNALSRTIFSNRKNKTAGLIRDFGFAIVWPLAMISSQGRDYINQTKKKWK